MSDRNLVATGIHARGLRCAVRVVVVCALVTGLAAGQEAPGPRPYAEVLAEIAGMARPAETKRRPLLVERPIVLDFPEQSIVLGYRTRADERPEPVAAAGFPGLTFQTRAWTREAFVEARRRLGDRTELGIRVPFVDAKETRPTRIQPLATAPFFTTLEDVRTESGIGDVTLTVARAANRPGLSRRVALDLKLSNATASVPDARSLPLGSGQMDMALSYGVKRTRGRFAATAVAGATLRLEGTASDLSGRALELDPGDQLQLTLRADRAVRDWLTASLVVEGQAAGRESVGGVEVAGTSRQVVTATPVLTYQASEVLEVIASARYSMLAHGVADAPLFEAALRWRY